MKLIIGNWLIMLAAFARVYWHWTFNAADDDDENVFMQ